MPNVLRRAWRQKPTIRSRINWNVAPPGLVVCFPLNEFAGLPIENVTRQYGRQEGWLVPNSFGVTTWTQRGIDMSGGGVAGARGLTINLTAGGAPDIDANRRTVAYRSLARVLSGGAGVTTTQIYNGTSGGNHFIIQCPSNDENDPGMGFSVGGTGIGAVSARSSMIDAWHSILASWSSGLGVDARTGLRLYDDGTLVGSVGGGSAAAVVPNQLVGAPNAFNGEVEYWYEWNHFEADDTGLAAQLHDNPYWFFTAAKEIYYSFPPRVARSYAWVC